MKKILVSAIAIVTALVLVLTLAACGKTENTANTENNETEQNAAVAVADIYAKITESVTLPAETIEVSAADLLDYYGIDSASVAECKAIQDACGYKDEIVIIKVTDEDAAAKAEAQLKQHIEYQKNEMSNYDAEQFKILGSSEVVSNGLYVAMFISANQGEMATIFNSFFN